MWLISPDSFKGTLSASDACRAIARGVRLGWPGQPWESLPLGDGGDGTVAALTEAVGGVWKQVRVCDPLGRAVDAAFSVLADGESLLEMASASGLTLLQANELDPLRADTYGTGQLLLAASEVSDRITLGIGGSATVDGGIGFGRALGFRFLDAGGREVTAPGPRMREIERIDDSSVLLNPDRIRLLVMCDVDNPLMGEEGAARIFGPQKGAGPDEVEMLEYGLARLGAVLEEFSGRHIRDMPGSGAAGGLGAALVGLLGAELLPGAERALDLVQFDRRLSRGVQLVLTGEGCLDAQSLGGKLPVSVARRARSMGIPAVALPGMVSGEDMVALRGEFAAIVPAIPEGFVLEDEAAAARLLVAASERATSCIRLGNALLTEEMRCDVNGQF